MELSDFEIFANLMPIAFFCDMWEYHIYMRIHDVLCYHHPLNNIDSFTLCKDALPCKGKGIKFVVYNPQIIEIALTC